MPIENSYLNENTKFCSTCSSEIHKKAEICPHCGVRCLIQDNKIVLSNSSSINLTLIFSVIGSVSGVIMGSSYFFIIYIMNINNMPIFMYFTLFLMFFSSLFGFLGYLLSSKNKKLSILEYIISSIGILITTIISFGTASSIPSLSLVYGISPIFFIFLGLISIIFFILAIFQVYGGKSGKNKNMRSYL